jgi:hypothetical protein
LTLQRKSVVNLLCMLYHVLYRGIIFTIFTICTSRTTEWE